MDTSQTATTMRTPSTSRKRFQKLSLRKAALSCPPRQPARSGANGEPTGLRGAAGARSVSPVNTADFDTPPFVTKRRPKYTSSTFIQNLTDGTPEFVISEYFQNSQPIKDGPNMVSSTPILEDNQKDTFDLSNNTSNECRNEDKILDRCRKEDKILDGCRQEDKILDVCRKEDKILDVCRKEDKILDVCRKEDKILDGCLDSEKADRLSGGNDNCNASEVSPKTANIMNDIYGDVWKHTPGLFKKSRSVFKSRKKDDVISDNDNNFNDVLVKLDALNLYVKSLTDVKTKQTKQDVIPNYFKTTTKDFEHIKFGEVLKPKMLSFELADDLIINNDSFNDNNDVLCPRLDSHQDVMPDLLPCPNLDDSDLIIKKRKVKKKYVFRSSPESENDKENLLLEMKKPFNDDSGLGIKPVKKLRTKKYRDIRKSDAFNTSQDHNCSIIILETGDEINAKIMEKTGGKKNRKLFAKTSETNYTSDDVEFVSEGVCKADRIFEIFDSDSRQDEIDKNDKTNVKKATNELDELLTRRFKDISLKPKENITVKEIVGKDINDVPKKVVPKKKALSKKETLGKDNFNVDDIQLYSFMASLADNIPSWRCDKEAKLFKENYKKRKEELLKRLFVMFNEKVFENQLDADLPIVWNTNLISTAGRANNKIVRSKTTGQTSVRRSTVELSSKVVDCAQRLRDTLAHELCHSAAWLIDGQLKDGHGPCWKKWVAKTLHEFPELVAIPVCHTLSIHCKYTYKCVKCGYSIDRHSKSIDTERKRCGYCYGTLECLRNKKNKDGLVVSTPVKRTQRQVSGFALFVKENYGNVRGAYTPHKQAMQFLGKQYANLKGTPKET